jgi:hypothetical protein
MHILRVNCSCVLCELLPNMATSDLLLSGEFLRVSFWLRAAMSEWPLSLYFKNELPINIELVLN